MLDACFQKYERITGFRFIDATTDPPLLCPPDEKTLGEIVRAAYSDGHKLILRGAGTCFMPSYDALSLHVSTRELTEVAEINAGDFLMVVQSGCVVDAAANSAEKHGLYLPFDPTSGDISTIGGAYMTGSSGLSAAAYGNLSRSVIGVRCMTAHGDSVTFGGRTVKNVTGYDVTRFLAGTMGLYAIVLEITLKLLPLPELRAMVTAEFPSCPDLEKLMNGLLDTIKKCKRFELIAEEGLDSRVQFALSFEGFSSIIRRDIQTAKDALNDAGASDVGEETMKHYWVKRRNISRVIAVSGLYTVTVPPAASSVFLHKLRMISPSMTVAAHILAGRFHVVCPQSSNVDKITQLSLAVGGKIPVEWGYAGRSGISGLFTCPELEIARAIKRELDPQGILNPHIRL